MSLKKNKIYGKNTKTDIRLILIAQLNTYCMPFISFLIVFIFLILIAYLIHILIEKPFQKNN